MHYNERHENMTTRTSNKEAAKILNDIRELLGFSHITPEHQALRKENERLREKNDALRIEIERIEEGKGYAELKILYDQLDATFDQLLSDFDTYKYEHGVTEPEG